jgi:hypothetical protein
MEQGEYGSQSLRFVRTVLGAAPRFASAAHAAHVLPLVTGVEPTVGAVVFYGSLPYGHCGIYLGSRVCLTVDHSGWPRLYALEDEHVWGGPLLGWVRGDNFRAASAREGP